MDIFISFLVIWSLYAILYNTFMILHFSSYQIYMSSCHTNYLTFSAMIAMLSFYWDIPPSTNNNLHKYSLLHSHLQNAENKRTHKIQREESMYLKLIMTMHLVHCTRDVYGYNCYKTLTYISFKWKLLQPATIERKSFLLLPILAECVYST